MSIPEIFEKYGQFNDAYIEELSAQSPDVVLAELTQYVQCFDYAVNPIQSEKWIESLLAEMTDSFCEWEGEPHTFEREISECVYILSKAAEFKSDICKHHLAKITNLDVLLRCCQNDNERVLFLTDANMYYVIPAAADLITADQVLVDITPAIVKFFDNAIAPNDYRYNHKDLFERYRNIVDEGKCTSLHNVCALSQLIGRGPLFDEPIHTIMLNLFGDRADNVINIAQLLQLQNSETYWREALNSTVLPSVETPKF